MRNIAFAFAALLVSAFVLSACANTVRGVGEDVKSTGHAVKQAVQ